MSKLMAKKDTTIQIFAVPVQMTDTSVFDDSFSALKEKFTAEMRRVEDAMVIFSKNLKHFYGIKAPMVENSSNTEMMTPITRLDNLKSSPLIEDDGENKVLTLQFDVSQFRPDEVKAEIVGGILKVSAHHEDLEENNTMFMEYYRDFMLPRGVEPSSVTSVMSREGVLTVRAPLPPMILDDGESVV